MKEQYTEQWENTNHRFSGEKQVCKLFFVVAYTFTLSRKINSQNIICWCYKTATQFMFP